MHTIPPAINSSELKSENTEPFTELERSVYAALETYSNVHRGSGHKSLVTTHLFEQARTIVLEYLKLDKDKFKVIFCSGRGARALKKKMELESYTLRLAHQPS